VVLVGVLLTLVAYDGELKRNGYPTRPALYGLVGRLMYAAVLWASYQSYRKGSVRWKGREYPVTTPEASNIGRNR
jgi:hypothetical protein